VAAAAAVIYLSSISPSLSRIQDLYRFYLTISVDARCD
jgi:hypothetical protein